MASLRPTQSTPQLLHNRKEFWKRLYGTKRNDFIMWKRMPLVDVTGIEIKIGMDTNKNPCRRTTKSPLTKTRKGKEEKRNDNTNRNPNAGGRTIRKKRWRRRVIDSHTGRCRARTTNITHHHQSSAWFSTSRVASLIVFTLSATLVLFDDPTCITIPHVVAVPISEYDYSQDANAITNTNPSINDMNNKMNSNSNNNNNSDAKRAEAATERTTAKEEAEDKRKKEEKIEHYNNKNVHTLESNSGAYQRGRDGNYYAHHKGEDNSDDRSSKVILTVAPLFDSSLSYPVGTADFGHDIDHTRFYYYKAVIAKAPSDSAHLCKIPDNLGTNSEDIPDVPVALLVSLGAGGCDVLTQAGNALKIQQDITKNLKYVLFYNNDPNNPEAIATLSLGGTSPYSSRVLAPITESPSASSSMLSTLPPSGTASTLPTFTTRPTLPPSRPRSTLPPFTPRPTRPSFIRPTTFPPSTFGTTATSSTPTTWLTWESSDSSSLYRNRVDKNETQTDDFYDIIIDIDEEVNVNDIDDDHDDNDDHDDDIGTENEEGNDDGLQDFLLKQERERKKFRHELRQELIENDSMVFVSMSTSAGVQILAKMDEKVEDNTYTVKETQANPEFLEPGFMQWSMIMSLDRTDSSYRPGYMGSNNDLINRITDDAYTMDSIRNIDDDGNGSDNGDRFKNGGRHSDSYPDNAPSTFNILKFVLFGLLIISPCLRAFHLWWVGGGRIRLRHSEDDDNRVVGLQYIPPMENWFGAYEPTEGERVPSRLTHEQVMSLPEIIYRKPCFDDDDENKAKDENQIYNESDDRSENTEEDDNAIDVSKSSDDDSTDDGSAHSNITLTTMNSPDRQSKEGNPSKPILPSSFSEENFSLPKLPTSPERVVSTSSASTNRDTTPVPPSSSSSSVGSKEELPLDEEQPADAPLSFRTQRRLRAFTTTTCTTCSICIDEFEEGEKIRLLPLCGHGFHTECILPWLKDRQGCCPLCKIAVLEDSNENGNGGNGNTRVEI
mmetsp:Transcript_15624/g.31975  ORF Transcript_15624/g.31975 Transcript_15624/m.31975 type:complete len:1001 (+) Transcript_15624:190-3192(+)